MNEIEMLRQSKQNPVTLVEQYRGAPACGRWVHKPNPRNPGWRIPPSQAWQSRL